jgi:hypothetical protein
MHMPLSCYASGLPRLTIGDARYAMASPSACAARCVRSRGKQNRCSLLLAIRAHRNLAMRRPMADGLNDMSSVRPVRPLPVDADASRERAIAVPNSGLVAVARPRPVIVLVARLQADDKCRQA